MRWPILLAFALGAVPAWAQNEPPKPAESPVRDDEHDAFGEELPVQPLRNPIAALTPIGSPVHDQQAEI